MAAGAAGAAAAESAVVVADAVFRFQIRSPDLTSPRRGIPV